MTDTAKEAGMRERATVLQIGGRNSVGWGQPIYLRVGTETKWEWRKATDAETEQMRAALAAAQPPVSEGVVEAGMRVSDEAIEAAARALWKSSVYQGYNDETKEFEWTRMCGIWRNQMRAALAAALPHLQAQEWTTVPLDQTEARAAGYEIDDACDTQRAPALVAEQREVKS